MDILNLKKVLESYKLKYPILRDTYLVFIEKTKKFDCFKLNFAAF